MNITKTIVTSMIALLVVAMGAGMAAAHFTPYPANTGTTPIQIGDDGAKLAAFEVGWAATLPKDASWKVQKLVGGVYVDCPNELQVKLTTDANYASTGDVTFTTPTPTHSFDIKDNCIGTGNAGEKYSVEFTDSAGSTRSFEITVWVDIVPEFATLAIPVVALLGLVLFMRRKKD